MIKSLPQGMTIITSACGNDDYTDISRLAARNIPCNHNRNGTQCEVCREIAEVELEIEGLHSRLMALHEKHRTLRIKRNNSYNIISKLPYDIVSNIFLLCLPQIDKERSPDDRDCLDFSTPCLPLTLGAVCDSWRRLVHSIPRLWTTISIDIYKSNLQGVSHYLQLSRSATLVVRLHAHSDYASASVSVRILDVITLVKQNLYRMAFLCIDLPCQYMKAFSRQGLDTPKNLPILEELHLHCSSQMCTVSHDFTISIDPPRPHRVVLSSSSIKNMQLDWSSLRHLSFDVVGWHPSESLITDALSLLSKGKWLQVVDFCIDIPGVLRPLSGMPRILTQNSIHNLRLYGYIATIFLKHTTMPNLVSLSLWEMTLHTTSLFLSFLQRSACPLTTLDLRFDKLEQEIIKFFRSTPKLQHLALDITRAHVDSEKHIVRFLEHLHMVIPRDSESASVQLGNHSQDMFLPLLRKFIYAGPMVHAPPSLFLDVVEARSGPFPTSEGDQVTQPLEEFIAYHLKPEEPLTERDRQRILRLNAAGKKVSVLEFHTDCEKINTHFPASYYH